MKYDSPSKNFVCKGCGLFVSSEKLDELKKQELVMNGIAESQTLISQYFNVLEQ